MDGLPNILDAHFGLRGVLVDTDAGSRIRWAVWANMDTGEYEAFKSDPEHAVKLGLPLDVLRYRGRAGHLRFIPSAPRAKGALARAQTPAEVAEMVRWARRGQPILMLPGRECDEPKCHALASWMTAHEQEVEPETDGEGVRWERAVTVRRSKWCHHHYRFPVFSSLRGVESEVEVTARPQ